MTLPAEKPMASVPSANAVGSRDSARRLPGLDLLRAAAILSVFMAHAPVAGTFVPPVVGLGIKGLYNAFSGVELFFVLSGFLVSSLLFSEYKTTGAISVRRFLVRRGLKIYPPFYFFLGCTIAVCALASMPPRVTAPRVAAEALFVQNYVPGVWGHTWSLGIEEHFYIVAAIVLALMARRAAADPFAAVPRMVAGVLVFCLMARCVTSLLVPGFSFSTHLTPSHLRFDSLAAGVGLAYAWHFHRDALTAWSRKHRTRVIGVALAATVITAIVPRHTFFGHTFVQSLQYVAHAALVLWAVVGVRPDAFAKLRIGQCACVIGRHSYSIYLWHQPVRDWTPQALHALLGAPPSANLVLATYCLGVIGVGIAASILVEQPFIAWRDRAIPAQRMLAAL